jgi:feruloyl esterase
MAKAAINVAYGKRPDRSYIGGCSNGGRHVLVAAARRRPPAFSSELI